MRTKSSESIGTPIPRKTSGTTSIPRQTSGTSNRSRGEEGGIQNSGGSSPLGERSRTRSIESASMKRTASRQF
ncbi:unnamed protein product [Amoebophrya sp. A25]|nr:unnamed protein product [Amoebophrya sp. A25]|eukprot:GSA25T00003742001.1